MPTGLVLALPGYCVLAVLAVWAACGSPEHPRGSPGASGSLRRLQPPRHTWGLPWGWLLLRPSLPGTLQRGCSFGKCPLGHAVPPSQVPRRVAGLLASLLPYCGTAGSPQPSPSSLAPPRCHLPSRLMASRSGGGTVTPLCAPLHSWGQVIRPLEDVPRREGNEVTLSTPSPRNGRERSQRGATFSKEITRRVLPIFINPPQLHDF